MTSSRTSADRPALFVNFALLICTLAVWAVVPLPAISDICDNCTKRHLVVGPAGDYTNLKDAYCDSFPGDVIEVDDMTVSEPVLIDGSNPSLCPGGKKGAAANLTIMGKNYQYRSTGVSTKEMAISEDAKFDSPQWQGAAAITFRNVTALVVGLEIEAGEHGVRVGTGATVKFVESIVRSGRAPCSTLLDVVSGGTAILLGNPANSNHPAGAEISYGLSFKGAAKNAVSVVGGKLVTQEVEFGNALPDSKLKSEYNVFAENADLTFSLGINDFGGFSKAAIYASNTTIDAWDLTFRIPNKQFDDYYMGDTIPKGPRPEAAFVFNHVILSRKDVRVDAYAPIVWRNTTATSVEVRFDFCPKSWAPYSELVDISESTIRSLLIGYDHRGKCHLKTRHPYSIESSNIGQLVCGGKNTSTLLNCDGNAFQ